MRIYEVISLHPPSRPSLSTLQQGESSALRPFVFAHLVSSPLAPPHNEANWQPKGRARKSQTAATHQVVYPFIVPATQPSRAPSQGRLSTAGLGEKARRAPTLSPPGPGPRPSSGSGSRSPAGPHSLAGRSGRRRKGAGQPQDPPPPPFCPAPVPRHDHSEGRGRGEARGTRTAGLAPLAFQRPAEGRHPQLGRSPRAQPRDNYAAAISTPGLQTLSLPPPFTNCPPGSPSPPSKTYPSAMFSGAGKPRGGGGRQRMELLRETGGGGV